MAGDTTDRLSNMPLEILHYIRSFLETIEVVRTCVLSKKWRYIWTSMPYLNFDVHSWFQDHFTDLGYFELQIKFWYFIQQVMKSTDGSFINKFRLHSGDFQNPNLYKLLCYAGKRNVQELDLIIRCGYYRNVTLKFPRVLQEALEKLRVEFDCFYDVPDFTSFSRLKSLHLVGIMFEDDVSAARLFSINTLLVEDLHLEQCEMSRITSINFSLCNLRGLTFVNMEGNRRWNDYVFFGGMTICSPKLLSFNYIGPMLHGYGLRNQLSLDNGVVRLFNKTCPKECILLLPGLVSDLCHAKSLTLSTLFAKYLSLAFYGHLSKKLGVGTKWIHCMSLLPNLRSLKLEMKCTTNHMEGLIHLLKHAPKLEDLVIYFKKGGKECGYWHWQEDVQCWSDHLKVVKMFNFTSHALALELVRFLLLHGKLLENMVIRYENQEMKSESFRKLSAFPTTSQDDVLASPGIGHRESSWFEYGDKDSDVDDAGPETYPSRAEYFY